MIMGDESTNMDHISLVIKFIKHAKQKKKETGYSIIFIEEMNAKPKFNMGGLPSE